MQIPEGLGLYWRDSSSVQIGLHPGRQAIFPGLYPREVPMLNLLRNPCTKEDVELWARSNQVDLGRAAKIWADVEATGLALDRSMPGTMARTEYAAAARAGTLEPDRAGTVAIEIHGGGLIGAVLALSLGLYGFGSISISDSSPITESVARWLGTAAFGKPFESAIRPRLQSSAQEPEEKIVISISSRVYPLHIARACLADDIPYLPVVIAEADIQIGPFVTGTPCIECVESARAEEDRAWPLLSAQAGRLPMLEAETASAFQACAIVIGELLQYVGRPDLEPRLSSSILHVPPPPLWPTVETVPRFQGCGCASGPVGVHDVEDR